MVVILPKQLSAINGSLSFIVASASGVPSRAIGSILDRRAAAVAWEPSGHARLPRWLALLTRGGTGTVRAREDAAGASSRSSAIGAPLGQERACLEAASGAVDTGVAAPCGAFSLT